MSLCIPPQQASRQCKRAICHGRRVARTKHLHLSHGGRKREIETNSIHTELAHEGTDLRRICKVGVSLERKRRPASDGLQEVENVEDARRAILRCASLRRVDHELLARGVSADQRRQVFRAEALGSELGD